MKNKILLGLGLIALFVTAFVLFNIPSRVGAVFSPAVSYNDSDIYKATSTPAVYLTANSASSTIYARTDGSDQFSFDICATASSSAGILTYKLYYTPQDITPTASTTWYQETTTNVASTSALTIHNPVIHYAPLATSTVGTTYVCMQINNEFVNAKNVKIDMSMIGSNASLWRMINNVVEQ